MKMKALIAIALLSILPGCATQNGTTTTPSEIATNAQPFVRPGVAAVTNVILLAQDQGDREALAAQIYAASAVVYTLATGEVMTPERIESSVASVAAGDNAKQIADVARAVMSIYAGVYPAIKDKAPSVVRQIVSDIAAGLQDAASVYIPKTNPA
jgi:type IV pilus biogenesis protein CpaD/CtpE